MLSRCSWCFFHLCLTLNAVFYSSGLLASPVDIFVPGFAIAVQHETVNDNVNYSPNLQAGGFADAVQKPRFQHDALKLSYSTSKRTQYHFTAAQRQMNSLRDAFVIDAFDLGLKRRLKLSKKTPYTLDIGVDASANRASEIYKNSYTTYAEHLITEVRIVEPRDARLSVFADLSVALSDRLQLQISASGGLSQTSHKEVVGSAQLEGNCNYAFNASSHGGSVRQLGRCGDLVSYEQHYPSKQTLNTKLGFSTADDLNYREYFFGPQVSLYWRRGAWTLSTGYKFRHYLRPKLDKRIRRAGGTPVSRSYSGFANLSVNVMRNWRVDALVKYQRAAFLDDIPLLYNALTYERYRGDGVIRYGLAITRFFD